MPPIDNGFPEPLEGPTSEQKFAGVLLVLAFFLAILVVCLANHTLAEAYEISQIVGGIGTLILSVLGTMAGLWWFIRRDPLRPRLNVEQEVTVLRGPDGQHLLQVFARLENVGEVSLSIQEWRIWVCPLDPLPDAVGAKLFEKSACTDQELKWESCAGRKIGPDCFDELRMRTGEIQEVIASVLVPNKERTVRVHSFFPHSALNNPGEDRGWTRYSIVNLEELKMNKYDKPSDRDTGNRSENYREPLHREPIDPTGRKDETYREPKPQGGGSQSDEKK